MTTTVRAIIKTQKQQQQQQQPQQQRKKVTTVNVNISLGSFLETNSGYTPSSLWF